MTCRKHLPAKPVESLLQRIFKTAGRALLSIDTDSADVHAFATHLNIGTPETLDLFRSFAEDIKQYPKYDGTRIVWVHLLPFIRKHSNTILT